MSEERTEKEQKIEWEIPKFMKEHQKITSAQKGTLIHLCMQNLNEKEEYTKEKIQKLVRELVNKQKITEKEAENIDIQKIYNFTKSNIWQEIKNASKVYKEQPFYYSIPAKEIYGEEVEENILVQGIIDLYYLDKQGNITLVDYKTDYVETGKEKELLQKYEKQLEIYKKALEEALQKKVENVYIYSTTLNKELRYNT